MRCPTQPSEPRANALTLIVTSAGRWTFSASSDFHSALGDCDPDYDSLGFAVRNLGFIKFTVLDRTLIQIELHPRNVGWSALRATQRQLLVSTARVFQINYLDREWTTETWSSAADAVTRLTQLCSSTSPDSTSPMSAMELRAALVGLTQEVDQYYDAKTGENPDLDEAGCISKEMRQSEPKSWLKPGVAGASVFICTRCLILAERTLHDRLEQLFHLTRAIDSECSFCGTEHAAECIVAKDAGMCRACVDMMMT
jgi:hypothetical protein